MRFSPHKERLAILGVGLLTNGVIVYAGDFLLYPFVILKMGIIKGGVTMTVISFSLCYLTLLFYDWSKKDWLGIETIKAFKDYNGRNKVGRLTSWVLKRSDPVALLLLSIKFDPFIITTYMRRGSHQYDGLSKRDWKIFISSLLIGNVYWTLACFMGITIFEWVWTAISRG